MGTLEKPDGSITEPGQDTLHHLTSAHFGEATKHQATIYKDNKYSTLDEVKGWKPNWISASKLELAIHQFKNKKSPGPYGLSPLVLKIYLLFASFTFFSYTRPVYFLHSHQQNGREVELFSYQNLGKVTTKLQNHGGLSRSLTIY